MQWRMPRLCGLCRARRENILFLGAAALLLAPVFLPCGVQRNNRVREILSALPKLLNGVVWTSCQLAEFASAALNRSPSITR